MHRAADNLAVAKRENEVILYEKDYKQRYQGFDPNSSESYIMFEFMQDHNMAQSVELAKFVQRRTCAAANRSNKGVKQAGFLVLRETSMPSCLIELGFISTPDEEQFLHSETGVSQLGRGIYQAFMDYKRKYDTNISYKPEVKKEPEVTKAPEVKKEPEIKKEPEVKKEPEIKKEPEVKKEPKPAKTEPEAAEVQAAPAKEEKKSEVQSPVVEAPAAESTSAPVFKVQILASDSKLPLTSPQFKKQEAIDSYQEGGLYKYTVGASTDYNEIYQLRKTLLDKFPQAFIIAFKDGQKMDVRQAIVEFKNNKRKQTKQ
jgi:N-acetylmuramoyl-L-alanine amidase